MDERQQHMPTSAPPLRQVRRADPLPRDLRSVPGEGPAQGGVTTDIEDLTVKEILEEAVAKFNERIKRDPKLFNAVQGQNKLFRFTIDGTRYHYRLNQCEVFPAGDGYPDVGIECTEEVFRGLADKSIKPLKAWMDKTLKIRAEARDLLLARKFIGGGDSE